MSINMQNDNEQPIDPYLNEKLDLLRDIPSRDPQAAARGRERFLAELESIPELNPTGATSGILGWFKRKKGIQEDKPMTKRFALSAVLAVVVIAVLLFGGAGATAFAAQTSLPGDALFPVKTGLEQTQVRLARDAYNQAQLHLRFAERRLEEIAKLIKSGRFEDVKIASTEFEYYVQQALQSLQVVMTGDPARASQLTEQISAAMLAYVNTLKGVWVEVPENVRPAVLQAILTAQDDDFFEDDSQDELEFTGVVEAIGANSWQVSGTTIAIGPVTEVKGSISIGDTVKVHAMINADGSLVARQIGFTDQDGEDDNGDDSNDNGDDANDNGDDSHDNGDDSNDNGDDSNDNGDDSNDNGDDSNDNGDDSNDNGDDSNDNGDDSNDNGDDSNDNGDDSNDNGDDSNDNGDDSNDNGDDSNDNGNDNSGNDNGDDGDD